MSTPHHTRVHPSHSKQGIEPTMWRPSPTLWILIHFGGVLFWGPNNLEPDRAKVPSLRPFLLAPLVTTNRNPENDLRIEINDLLTHPSPPWCPGAHQKLLNFNGSALRDTIWLAKIPGVRWPMVALMASWFPMDATWSTGAGGHPSKYVSQLGSGIAEKIFQTFGKKSHPAAWKLTRLLLAT